MTIALELPKGQNILSLDFVASEDLSSSQYRAVALGSAASGKATIGLPSGQGVITAGILNNDPESGEMADVRMLGTIKAVANSTFNTGVELTVADATGRLEGASADDYVIAIALQGASAQNHEVWVELVTPYQKN